ncbi:MAG: redoxin domain-containing protein [Phycisphaerae bacterium]
MKAAMQHHQNSTRARRSTHATGIALIVSLIASAGWAHQPAGEPAPTGARTGEPASAGQPGETAKDEHGGAEYFTRAADALKKAQSISYRVRYRATGGMEQYSAAVEADVRMLRDSTAMGYTNGWVVRSIGSGMPKPNVDRMDFDVAWIGNSVEFVSHAEKKVIERRSSREARSTAFSVANSARLQELFASKPFSKEVAANAQYKTLERQTVGGVECDVVEVTFSDRKGKTVWAFGAADHLPRRVESLIENVMMTGSTIVELDDVRVETTRPPAMSRSSVRVEVPEGYAEDRPVRPTPAASPAATQAETKSVDGTPSDSKAPGAKPETKESRGEEASPKGAATPEAKPFDEAHAAPEGKPAEAAANERPPLTVGPDFDLRASTGGKVSLASMRGRVVVLEFGGSWCLPCRESRAELDQLTERFSSKSVGVLALSLRDKSPDAAMERFRSQNHKYPLLVEADATAEAYRVRAYPTYVVLDGEGTIIKMLPGYEKGKTVDAIANAINDHLAARRPGA